MWKHLLILALVITFETGCDFQYGERYKVVELSNAARSEAEQKKREFLQLEDIQVGTGPVAAWGRRISANINVRYMDGTSIYSGPVFTVYGFFGMPETSIHSSSHLFLDHPGIRLGLNGMTIGGRRRMIIDRKLVCIGLREEALPSETCHLKQGVIVKKQNLIVEATLTEACTPIKLIASVYWVGFNVDIRCRNEELPRFDPALPIWHFY